MPERTPVGVADFTHLTGVLRGRRTLLTVVVRRDPGGLGALQGNFPMARTHDHARVLVSELRQGGVIARVRRRNRIDLDDVVGLHAESTLIGGVGDEVGQLLATRFDRKPREPGGTHRGWSPLHRSSRVLVVVAREHVRDQSQHDDDREGTVVVAWSCLLIGLAASRRPDPTYPFTCCALSHGGNATKELDQADTA